MRIQAKSPLSNRHYALVGNIFLRKSKTFKLCVCVLEQEFMTLFVEAYVVVNSWGKSF